MEVPLGGLVLESLRRRPAVGWRPTVGVLSWEGTREPWVVGWPPTTLFVFLLVWLGSVLHPSRKPLAQVGVAGAVSRPGRGEPLATSPGPSGDPVLGKPQSTAELRTGLGRWKCIPYRQLGVSCVETLGVRPENRTLFSREGPLMDICVGELGVGFVN